MSYIFEVEMPAHADDEAASRTPYYYSPRPYFLNWQWEASNLQDEHDRDNLDDNVDYGNDDDYLTVDGWDGEDEDEGDEDEGDEDEGDEDEDEGDEDEGDEDEGDEDEGDEDEGDEDEGDEDEGDEDEGDEDEGDEDEGYEVERLEEEEPWELEFPVRQPRQPPTSSQSEESFSRAQEPWVLQLRQPPTSRQLDESSEPVRRNSPSPSPQRRRRAVQYYRLATPGSVMARMTCRIDTGIRDLGEIADTYEIITRGRQLPGIFTAGRERFRTGLDYRRTREIPRHQPRMVPFQPLPCNQCANHGFEHHPEVLQRESPELIDYYQSWLREQARRDALDEMATFGTTLDHELVEMRQARELVGLSTEEYSREIARRVLREPRAWGWVGDAFRLNGWVDEVVQEGANYVLR